MLNPQEIEQFIALEAKMNGGGLMADNFITSYQKSDDIYKRLLLKLIQALEALGEPHAAEKRQAVLEELGTMGPALFLTPWEISLHYLDRTYGDFDRVVDFYRQLADNG